MLASIQWFDERTAFAEPRRYTLDQNASQLVIHVAKSGLFRFASRETMVEARAVSGTVVADPDQIARSSVEITFSAAALRVTAGARKAQEVMIGSRCLDTSRFPIIRFVSKTVGMIRRAGASHDLLIRGNLTLHGVTRGLTIPARVDFKPNFFEATGATTLNQKDFGITPISIAGILSVKNEVRIHWRLVGRLDP